jgi:hypothetical protein
MPAFSESLDLVHGLEDFFPLDFDLNTYGLSLLCQFMAQI